MGIFCVFESFALCKGGWKSHPKMEIRSGKFYRFGENFGVVWYIELYSDLCCLIMCWVSMQHFVSAAAFGVDEKMPL
ncbi:hypothetical protein U1Q18_052206, partial [Sarracenia purpurea var. burkii]